MIAELSGRALSRRELLAGGLKLLGFGASLAAYAGCAPGPGTAVPGPTPGGPFDLGTIAITWYPIFLYHLPVSVALEAGEFGRRGLKIKEMVGARGGGETIRTLTAGDLLMGEAATGAAVKSVWKSGDPYVIVGGGVKSPSDIFWIVPENSPLKSVRDLVGKRVSYTSPGSVTEQVLILTLSRAGIDPGSVQLIAAGGIGEGFALLKRGEVDACAMLPSSFTERTGFRVLFNAWDTVPNYFQTLILAHRRLVERNPEVIRSFLAARRWGVDQIQKDPDRAAQVYAKTANISLELAREAIRFAGAERSRYYSDGRLDPEGLRLAEEGMRIAKEIGPDERVPWTQLVNQSFLADDQRVQLS
jgi:NitT/TauT family transport system substrate-binding protein